jgi:MEMO1 family protein
VTMLPGLRPPAAAGSFYPETREALARTVDRLLEVEGPGLAERPAAVIVPHAGYAYSGRVAAIAYAAVRAWASGTAAVAIFGPAHFALLEGCATTSATAWRTPLGDVGVDERLRDVALATGLVAVADAAHAGEHSLEVQLPFLQRLVGDRVRFLPVAVGDARAADVASVIQEMEPVADLVVVSTDLSHYEDVATARRQDDRTIAGIVARDPDAIASRDACGRYALRGALAFARRNDREIRLLAAATSADAGGEPDRVVGYASFAIGS